MNRKDDDRYYIDDEGISKDGDVCDFRYSEFLGYREAVFERMNRFEEKLDFIFDLAVKHAN